MKKITFMLCSLSILALGGCQSPSVINLDDKSEVQDMEHTMQLEYRDWNNAAEKMTTSMINSGAFADVKNPVIAISDVKNDTMQRFDTDILVKKIRVTLLNSGKAKVSTAHMNMKKLETAYVPVSAELHSSNNSAFHANTTDIKAKGYAEIEYERDASEDEATYKVRNLRDNKEYDASTIAGKGTLVAPNMSLSGKMMQRNLKIKAGMFSNKDTRVEYYLQMTLTNIKTGLSVWEGEEPILKEGSYAPTW